MHYSRLGQCSGLTLSGPSPSRGLVAEPLIEHPGSGKAEQDDAKCGRADPARPPTLEALGCGERGPAVAVAGYGTMAVPGDAMAVERNGACERRTQYDDGCRAESQTGERPVGHPATKRQTPHLIDLHDVRWQSVTYSRRKDRGLDQCSGMTPEEPLGSCGLPGLPR
jgi:hypothetical protein